MNLTLTQQPANFSEIPSSSFATGATLTAAIMQALNENIKFAAARTEEFYGYYTNGQTVILPVSPLDGYQYARNELSYLGSVFWTAALLPGLFAYPDAGIDTDGGPVPSSRGYPTGAVWSTFLLGPGQITRLQLSVDQATGLVGRSVSYGGGLTAADGILMVTTIARRLR